MVSEPKATPRPPISRISASAAVVSSPVNGANQPERALPRISALLKSSSSPL